MKLFSVLLCPYLNMRRCFSGGLTPIRSHLDVPREEQGRIQEWQMKKINTCLTFNCEYIRILFKVPLRCRMNSATLQAKKAEQCEESSQKFQRVYFLDVGKEEIRSQQETQAMALLCFLIRRIRLSLKH